VTDPTAPPGPGRQGRTLTLLAWANVVLHVAGLAFAYFGMRPGSPLVLLARRLEYLAGAPLGWSLGWATWMLCGAALVTFFAVLVHRLGDRADLARLGLMVAVAAAAFDICCDGVYIALFPSLAAATHSSSENLFLLVERMTGLASLLIANGGYSVGTLLIVLALRGRPALVPGTVVVGYGVAGFGLLLAAAGLTGVPWHAEWATPPTIGLYCVWVLLVARSFEPGGGPS
jgi:hypothetical protein